MSVLAVEGVVENGQIRLETELNLPDNPKVYVIVPGIASGQKAHIVSPRLVHPEQIRDFTIEITEEPVNASL
jgi:hypothetical protein